jgi:hypothetical protein
MCRLLVPSFSNYNEYITNYNEYITNYNEYITNYNEYITNYNEYIWLLLSSFSNYNDNNNI